MKWQLLTEKDGSSIMKTYNELELMFKNNSFREIDSEPNAKKFYYLRSISRSADVSAFCSFMNLRISKLTNTQKLEYLLSSIEVNESDIETFINKTFELQVSKRNHSSESLVRELNKVQDFNWGGSFGNSLETNIVNNYVKKITSYDELNNKIDNELLASMRGYTINSWYNHWSSILIEDIFKQNSKVLPTIGLIKKIDFFIDGTPYDLKVTYFPEALMKEKLKDKGFGVELTRVKQKCRELNIPIDSTMSDKSLNIQLQNALSESIDPQAKIFLDELKDLKKKIIKESIINSDELIQWLYENQGNRRFDATNRFFLILTDTENIFESWKLKRNLPLLTREINTKINQFITEGPRELQFHWNGDNGDNKDYQIKSGALFISK